MNARPLMVAALVSSTLDVLRSQEMEPRAYAANPVHIGFALALAGYSTGNVVFDPTVPIDDVTAQIYSAALGGGYTFPLFGRTASGSLAVPFAWVTAEGNVEEERRSADREGFADARVRLSLSLLGGKALRLPEFAQRKPRTIIGTSLTVIMPTGEYLSDKLINIGAHRWAFKPEMGLSHPAGAWTLELYAGWWLFTSNASFFGGKLKEQRPMSSVQAHVAYTVRPRVWLAADATYYAGGRTVVDGVPASVSPENTRVGLTLSLPQGRSYSWKLAWSTGASTRYGADFDTFAIGLQRTFLGRQAPPRT